MTKKQILELDIFLKQVSITLSATMKEEKINMTSDFERLKEELREELEETGATLEEDSTIRQILAKFKKDDAKKTETIQGGFVWIIYHGKTKKINPEEFGFVLLRSNGGCTELFFHPTVTP